MPSDPRLLKPSDFQLPRFSCSLTAKCAKWESMETTFGMTAENGSLPQREISYVIAVDTRGDPDHTCCSQCREQAVRSISSLENYLARMGIQAQSQVGSLEETEKGQEVWVGGFWVFPRDVFDGQEPQHAGEHSYPMNFVDLSSRSPALGVFDLPKGSNRMTT